MKATESDFATVTPLPAASLADYYPQFSLLSDSNTYSALRAWQGTIQPFASDDNATSFLRCLDHKAPVDVCAGTIDISMPTSGLEPHWAEPLLLGMCSRFSILVLEFEDSRHPRAYCKVPEISRLQFPFHPHLRDDLSVSISGRSIPALCIYSGACFQYDGEVPKVVQFLDQVSTFLARHLVWCRTRKLFTRGRDGRTELLRLPLPGELIVDHEPRLRAHPATCSSYEPQTFWMGYWPGPVAPQGSIEHLKTISPENECWCCSGQRYKDCHMKIEETLVGSG